MVIPVVLAVALVGIGCVLYGILIERRWYRLVRHRLAILPATGPESLSVLHLSDLHFVHDEPEKSRRFLASLPHADVTVVTGDFLAEPEGVETVVDMLRPARGRLASWYVLGSNDYFAPRPLNYFAYFQRNRKRRSAVKGRAGDLVAQLNADGWTDLTNVRHDVDLDGLAVELLGLDDAHIRWQDYRVAPRTGAGSVRVRRDAFAGLGARSRLARLRPDRRRAHARWSGLPAVGGRPGDELFDASAAGQGRDRDGRAPCCTPPRAWEPASTPRSGSGAGQRPRCWSCAGGPSRLPSLPIGRSTRYTLWSSGRGAAW